MLGLKPHALAANDTVVEGVRLVYRRTEHGGHERSVSFNSGTGVVTYTPSLNYHGAAIFTYTISDGNGSPPHCTFPTKRYRPSTSSRSRE